VFTGIVEEVGTVEALDRRPGGVRLAVRAPRLAPLAAVGDSVAISGCCLTAVAVDGDVLRFEAVPETLQRTSLGALTEGDGVNLEDALRAGEPFGGHLVQGHVDGVATVVDVRPEGDGHRLQVRVPATLAPYVVEKGSVAVAGVSLTVAAVDGDTFEVALIPHTWSETTLSRLAPGDPVNLEADVVAKYVERLLDHRAPVQ
jgi:riboflavin synthase